MTKPLNGYTPVFKRLQIFREKEKYKGYSLETQMVKIELDEVILNAIIKNSEGNVIATGLAREVINVTKSDDKMSKQINKTSMLENCETSAWGRALANLGIGIEKGIASEDEITFAEMRQSLSPEEKEILKPRGERANEIIEKKKNG